LIDRVCVAIATGLYLSYIPTWFSRNTRLARERRWTGAGGVGTLLGWALFYGLPERGPALAWALAVAVAVASAVSGRAEARFGAHDDPRIIIDEVVGYWVAVAWLPRTLPVLLAGVLVFRALDVLKLPPWRSLERLPGGIGVVADDVGAGIAANLVLRVLGRLGLF
jgi:phosphatidylglycerophosphatase A